MKEVQLFTELVVEKFDHNVLLCVALAVVVIPITHTLLHRYLIAPLGQEWCKVQPANNGAQVPGRQKNLLKFQQSCWKCIVYLLLSTASAYALSKETFWRNTAEFWTDCKQRLPCAYQATPEMNFAYSLEAAYIMYAIPYATFIEARRKDYFATMAHHWVTFFLIIFSYAMGFTKVGLVIMVLHDVADPFLELAKMGNYASPPRAAFTNTCFIVFTVLWMSMRVFYLPICVIYSILFYAVDGVAGDADPTRFLWVWKGFSGLLIILFLLHLFWTYMILKIALQAITSSGEAKDSREVDDGDDDQHTR